MFDGKARIISIPQIQGLSVVSLDSFRDERGENVELYSKDSFGGLMPEVKVVSMSRSKVGVLRGFHGDSENWKAIRPNRGHIQFVALDARPESGTFEKWAEFSMDSSQNEWIVMPPGVVNAHYARTDCEFMYLLSKNYAPQDKQIHVKWNKYPIPWDNLAPILSKRDA